MLRHNPKVSVIIAVYNVEKYIEKCVRSLFSQTLDDIEFIFVDDCSPDDSISIMLQILKEFPHREKQVVVIRHDMNKGVSASRQDGIDSATGEYIIHCDPDDWVDVDMYKLLYNKAKETDSDFIICDYCNVNNDSTVFIKRSQKPKELTSISILESLSGLNNVVIQGGLCNKLIKRICYRTAMIPDSISNGEDVYMLFQILHSDLKIAYVDQLLYYYRYNPTSLSHTHTKDTLNKDISLIDHFKDLIKESKNKRYIACCKSRIVLIYYWGIFCLENIPDTKIIPFNYQRYIFLNKRISIYPKILLLLSLNGLHRQAKMTIKFLSKLKRTIKRHIIGKNA